MRRSWTTTRHAFWAELGTILGLFAVYEATRGLTAGGEAAAIRHAHDVVALERSLHIFVENEVQHLAREIPGVLGVFGIAYLLCHLGVTGLVLVWLHRRRPGAYALVRTTLLVATAVALIAYIAYPTAPPRLSNLGILDTVSGHAHVDLDRGLIHSLYNPYAAIPSMHAGYALVVGFVLVRYAHHLLVRFGGILYPLFVTVVIVATGNHFFVDAIAGVLVVAFAAVITAYVLDDRRRGIAATAPQPSLTWRALVASRRDVPARARGPSTSAPS